MTWFLFTGDRRIALIPGLTVTIGRDPGCDVVLDHPRVSRQHLAVTVEGDRWRLRDTSANGTFSGAGRVSEETGDGLCIVSLGGGGGPVVIVSDDPHVNALAVSAGFAPQLRDAPAPVSSGSAADLHLFQAVTRFGRADDNDVILPGVLASAHHAHLVKGEVNGKDTLDVVDLASARGTFVNGQRVSRGRLGTGDRVSMGGSAFIVTDTGALHPIVDAAGVGIEVRELTVAAGTIRLLDGVTFTVPPRSVLAVVGPSGSGKSTLLGAMTGFSPATSGAVLVDGRDLYASYDELRFQIGLVPQADLVPAQLRVKEALGYAARLRFPRDVRVHERRARVQEVLADLGLTARAGLRIDRLSGGQRKRVSVALELLTQPILLFLDEPTSGLDPGLDRQVMVLLREMADAGRTVIVVTHAVENLALADQVLVLAAGGHLAYIGPPGQAPEYFGVPDISSVFLALEGTPGKEWTRRWQERLMREDSPAPTAATGDAPAERPSDGGRVGAPPIGGRTRARVSRPTGALGQFTTMIARNVQVILADRTYAALLLVLPLVLAFTGFLVGSADGLGSGPGGLNPESRLLLLVLVLGAVFTGGATSVQELVKDRVIYQRERAVGLSRGAYVAAKALVLGLIAALQGFVFGALSLIGRPGPDEPLILPGHLDIVIMVAAATVTSCMLGLVFSAVLPTRDAALPALVIATMVQVVFSGAIPLRYPEVLDAVGWLMPGYWQFEAMAASVNLDQLLGPQAPGSWVHETATWWLSAGVLGLMSLLFILLAIIAVGRHDPGRTRRR